MILNFFLSHYASNNCSRYTRLSVFFYVGNIDVIRVHISNGD